MPRLRTTLVTGALVTAASLAGLWVWRRWGYPVTEREREVPAVPEPPVEAPPEPAGRARVQSEADGVGPRFHRRYEVTVADPTKSPEVLMACIADDIQAYVPDEIAVFTKTVGAPGRLAAGDEFDITIRSPWNGPVRVAQAEPTRFTLATLDGHMEAGQIRFEATAPTPGALHFSIESWARSRDELVDAVYDGLGLAKEAQKGMWTFFCERVAEDCGGQRVGEIRVLTERESDG